MLKRILFFTLFAITLSSCAKTTDVAKTELKGENSETTTKSKTDLQNYDLAEGMDMPNVVLETNKGTTFELSKTDKPVLINFWATWCPPCRAEMPGLQNLYEEYGSKIDFVMVDLGESKETVQDFLVENEIYTFPVAYDVDDTYGFKFNITAIPTTFIVGKDKKIKNLIGGMRSEAQYKEFIEKAINE